MSLTTADLQAIKSVVIDGINSALEAMIIPRLEALESEVSLLRQSIIRLELRVTALEFETTALKNKVEAMDGRLQAVENDIKEIYGMLKKPSSRSFGVTNYSRLTYSQKLDVLGREIARLRADTKTAKR